MNLIGYSSNKVLKKIMQLFEIFISQKLKKVQPERIIIII